MRNCLRAGKALNTAAKELEKGESVALVFADGKALCDVTDVIVEKGDVNG